MQQETTKKRPRGGQPKSPEMKHSETLEVRLRPSEYQALRKHAAQKKEHMSAIARRLLVAAI